MKQCNLSRLNPKFDIDIHKLAVSDKESLVHYESGEKETIYYKLCRLPDKNFKDEESIIQVVMDAMEASLRTQKSILGTTPPEQSDYSHSCSSTTPQILLKISALSKWIQRDASSIIIEETLG